MKNILIISGHTDLNDSVANKTILEELENKLPDAKISYLDKLYPDFKIGVKAEQEKLLKADIIVLQYPVFWYSMPSLLEHYMEKVFEYGFSHGTDDMKLKGKRLVVSLTTGAKEEMYTKDNMGEIDSFLNPIKATCKLCEMDYLGHIYTGGVSFAFRNEPGKIEQMKLISKDHANRLIKLLNEA